MKGSDVINFLSLCIMFLKLFWLNNKFFAFFSCKVPTSCKLPHIKVHYTIFHKFLIKSSRHMPLRCQCYHQRATLWRSGSIGTQWAARSARSVWWAEQREQDRDEGKRQNVCGREKTLNRRWGETTEWGAMRLRCTQKECVCVYVCEHEAYVWDLA